MRGLFLACGLLLLCACSDSSAAPSPSAPAAQHAQTAAPQPVAAKPAEPPSASAAAPAPTLDAAALARENADLRARLDEAQTRIAALRSELDAERSARMEREQQWLRFTRGIRELSAATGIPAPDFPVMDEGPPAGPLAPPPDATLARREKRSQELLRKLRALFTIDEVDGLDLLEIGLLGDGSIGPVVLRTLDARGRPTGTLCAERLRFECSQAARTLTLVLEQGYERRAGQRIPFPEAGGLVGAPVAADASEGAARRGTRRIELPEVDPTPWIEAAPELFGAQAVRASVDDGKHDRTALRVALNQLLREDAAGGWWRLSGLGGVQKDVLRDVALDGLDREGNLERKLFADRLTVLEQEHGVQILLEQGAQLRGDHKTPFLDGRYRIFLPRAQAEAWIAAGVPLVRLPAPAPVSAPAPDVAPSDAPHDPAPPKQH